MTRFGEGTFGSWKARLCRGARATWIAVVLSFPAVEVLAERNHLRPSDFEPLTSIPWERKGMTVEGVLESLYRETNEAIRYEMLTEYLLVIPVRQLGQAFDICLNLEGTETPGRLLDLYLPIWTIRDPQGCWKRTRELFRSTCTGASWKAYERWENEPMKLTDPDVMRTSRFRIEPPVLLSFPVALESAGLPRRDRVRLLKEFADLWFGTFGTWPNPAPERPLESGRRLKDALGPAGDQWRHGLAGGNNGGFDAYSEILARRGLVKKPGAALEIVKSIADQKFDPAPGQKDQRPMGRPWSSS